MSHNQKTPNDYWKERSERRQQNTNRSKLFRHRRKRKRSLVSLLSMSSLSSNALIQSSNDRGNPSARPSESPQNDMLSSFPSTIFTDSKDIPSIDSIYSDVSNASEDEVSVHTASSSSAPFSSSDDTASDDSLEDLYITEHVLDHRPLYSSTITTVREFSIDLVEFCRSARLPDNQRTRLL